ncbi:MAG TPA: hypothetical protein VFO62_04920 [Candidatus Binatia bacterium]|nr:hypothetical protein [Candidatus Binatia bacterium]
MPVRRCSRRIVLTLTAAAMIFAGVTYVALEASGVVVVETDVGGKTRSAHVWFVRENGELWLEAGHPDSPWVRDLAGATTLRLLGEGLDGAYRFSIDATAEGHERIRTALRRKYGWRDRWIDALVDLSHSRLVVLAPVE